MRESLGTIVTHKWLFSGMDPNVFFQVVFEFERLSTFRTLELAEDLRLVVHRVSLSDTIHQLFSETMLYYKLIQLPARS